MNNYVISNNTLAIIPYLLHYSIVYEVDKIKIIKNKPLNIINYNCRLHGSSYKGRIDGTYNLIGTYYKSPVIIDDNIIFFPTTSPRLKKCSWINLDNVITINYNKVNKCSIINFINNKNIEFHTSFNILNNQLLKSTLLSAKIIKNKGQKV